MEEYLGGGPLGPLKARQVKNGVRAGVAEMGTPTPQETSPTSSSSALIDTACISVRDHREKTKLDVKVCSWDGK